MLEEIPQGAFRLPIAAAQVLPALMGKTYLDVNKNSPCVSGSGTALKSNVFMPFRAMPQTMRFWCR